MRIFLLLALMACGADQPPLAGQSCPTADDMVCGKTAGGSGVALLCTGGSLTYVIDCPKCNHVRNCNTELQCNGLNVANEGLHCDLQTAGACAIGDPTHVLECDNTNTWMIKIDCSTAAKSCGALPGGLLGCV